MAYLFINNIRIQEIRFEGWYHFCFSRSETTKYNSSWAVIFTVCLHCLPSACARVHVPCSHKDIGHILWGVCPMSLFSLTPKTLLPNWLLYEHFSPMAEYLKKKSSSEKERLVWLMVSEVQFTVPWPHCFWTCGEPEYQVEREGLAYIGQTGSMSGDRKKNHISRERSFLYPGLPFWCSYHLPSIVICKPSLQHMSSGEHVMNKLQQSHSWMLGILISTH